MVFGQTKSLFLVVEDFLYKYPPSNEGYIFEPQRSTLMKKSTWNMMYGRNGWYLSIFLSIYLYIY